MKSDLSLNARKITKDITVTVQIKGMFWVRIGMFFMKLGCWIGGFTLVDEFPMSLIQKEYKPSFVFCEHGHQQATCPHCYPDIILREADE